ncbi:MAG: ribonucleoside triphosphate reductase [Puniceicoccales bacterium]|jgi:ribonucleoside-triphosphate reductase|nr:ribonucleoside triphosphate reductase [Puniceicoccales bacterium]
MEMKIDNRLDERKESISAPAMQEEVYSVLASIGSATGEFDNEVSWALSREVISKIWEQGGCSSEHSCSSIEDAVENVLFRSQFRASTKMFILARDSRDNTAELSAKSQVSSVEQYLAKLDWKVRENSNMTYSLQGLNNYLAGTMSQAYWLHKVYPAAIRDAHESGDFHIHDLTQLSVYCVGWDLADLLREGFCGVPGKLEAKPPKHFRTALGQIVNFFYTLQGEAAGAQAFSSFDTFLAPFIRFDNLDDRLVEQALQEFLFNVNVPTRVGFQTPFTNITLDLFCPAHMANEPVIVGGEPRSETYGDFQAEMDIFNRALFKVMTNGDARGRIMTFPIPTINLSKNFDWDSEVLKGLWEMTSKYGIPYFSNFINSDMKPEDTRSMCCRLRIDNTQLERRGGGLFGANPLTGSVGVVTINLPRIAYLAGSEAEFFARLRVLMDLARDSLEIKRDLLEKMTDSNLYPYTTFYLKGIKERFGSYWKNHFSTIGIVGMNEACINLFGKNITTEEGRTFALNVLDYMRDKMIEYQKKTGNHYNLEATPAEGTSFRLAKKDKARFGSRIVCANDDDGKGENVANRAPFYTNSVHVPVNFTDDLFELLDNQDDMQTKFTGGTVVHIFLGERIKEPEAIKNLIYKIANGYKLPYFSLTPTFSICQSHGYIGGEHFLCPTCGSATEVYSRVVGYLRPVHQWNDGKQAEFKMRKYVSL